jgi:hypothetical protein
MNQEGSSRYKHYMIGILQHTNKLLEGTIFTWSTGYWLPVPFSPKGVADYYAAVLAPVLTTTACDRWLNESPEGKLFALALKGIPGAVWSRRMAPGQPDAGFTIKDEE